MDAALDLSHTQNIGAMIKNHFKHSQFIVVSLKEGMFQNANVIFRTKFVDGGACPIVTYTVRADMATCLTRAVWPMSQSLRLRGLATSVRGRAVYFDIQQSPDCEWGSSGHASSAERERERERERDGPRPLCALHFATATRYIYLSDSQHTLGITQSGRKAATCVSPVTSY